MNSFHMYLRSRGYYVPGTFLDTGDKIVKKNVLRIKNLCSPVIHILVEESDNKQNNLK